MKRNIYLKIKPLVLIMIFVFTLISCKHKTDFSSLTEVSYSKDIVPIINSNCAFSGCHGAISPEEFKLTSYEGLINGGITAGSPEKSKLYRSLKTLDDDIMPKKPYTELAEIEIQLIYVWIGQGAKNN